MTPTRPWDERKGRKSQGAVGQRAVQTPAASPCREGEGAAAAERLRVEFVLGGQEAATTGSPRWGRRIMHGHPGRHGPEIAALVHNGPGDRLAGRWRDGG